MSKFGERLYELRTEKKLSQEKLSQETGINQVTISAYERQKIHPTDDVIIVISEFFGVSTDFMLGLED